MKCIYHFFIVLDPDFLIYSFRHPLKSAIIYCLKPYKYEHAPCFSCQFDNSFIIYSIDGSLHPPFFVHIAPNHPLKQLSSPILVLNTVPNQIVIHKKYIFVLYISKFIQDILRVPLTILLAQMLGNRAEVTVKWATTRGLDRMPEVIVMKDIPARL